MACYNYHFQGPSCRFSFLNIADEYILHNSILRQQKCECSGGSVAGCVVFVKDFIPNWGVYFFNL